MPYDILDDLGRYERGVDLVVFGPTANPRYALGFRALPTDRLTALLVSQTRAVMVMPDFECADFVHATGFENVAAWSDRDGPGPAIKAAFEPPRCPSRLPIGGDRRPFTVSISQTSPAAAGSEPSLASELVGELRSVKDEDEQEHIGRTGELISHAIDFFQTEAAPGMTELELKRQLDMLLLGGGAETVDYVLVQAGANSAAAHHPAGSDRLEWGAPVLVDIAVCMNGYFADIAQQVVLGEPTDEYRMAYDVVARAQAAGVEAAYAGARVAAVAEAASKVIESAGYGEWSGPRTGHGIGADMHEAPSAIEETTCCSCLAT